MAATATGQGTRVDHRDAPVHRAPSGLPYRAIASGDQGSRDLFVAEQTLGSGEAVPRHTHPVEEVLSFLAGSGEATLGEERVAVGPGVSLILPPGLPHGFENTGTAPLRALVIFPGPSFASTTRVDTDAPSPPPPDSVGTA
ncbi:MAG: cupin domain-containing protein [Chloroflexota bacterium]|nr:cupin domain-containing protein [Chloroflexota bacterium]